MADSKRKEWGAFLCAKETVVWPTGSFGAHTESLSIRNCSRHRPCIHDVEISMYDTGPRFRDFSQWLIFLERCPSVYTEHTRTRTVTWNACSTSGFWLSERSHSSLWLCTLHMSMITITCYWFLYWRRSSIKAQTTVNIYRLSCITSCSCSNHRICRYH